ncbi:MAG: putative nucleotidyltransferase component of viral defense system [Candidatus Endobugula sp.]|jgi:predicted nucleotidyltransferase component of viral defense system
MKQVAQLHEQERKALFTETANAMRITAAAAEKDFWICWVLLHIFEDDMLRQFLRFKGGTSLSKCYHAIARFSEDIDLILDWTPLTTENPSAASRSKRQQRKLNQTINEEAQAFIAHTLFPRLIALMGHECDVRIDTEDPHTITITYPNAFAADYLRPQVRLEIGPLAAMLPMQNRKVAPYAAQFFPHVFEQASVTVPTITVARTFWEKLTILHAEAHRPSNKRLPNRYARHYYDVYQLVETGLYQQAIEQYDLLADVVAFKQTFYPSVWANYQHATLAGLVLQPSLHHIETLRKDYVAMQEMLFGDKPSFNRILNTLIRLEDEVHVLRDNNK